MTLTVSAQTAALRNWEVANTQRFLDSFSGSLNGPRRARLGHTGEYMIVQRLPLPNGYRPDEIDALLLIDQYPLRPPIGLYLLNAGNDSMVQQLRGRFNAFRDAAFHEAPSIAGYTWICYAYSGNQWRFNAQEPNRGDNVAKFLSNFYTVLS